MRLRFYIDPETGLPHIYKHNITESEVLDALIHSGEDRPGREGARVSVGQTRTGRYLRVIYVPELEPKSVFVITGYELKGKPLKAYLHRREGRLI